MHTATAGIEIAETGLPAVLDVPFEFPGDVDAFEEMDGHLGDLRTRIAQLTVEIEAYRSEFDQLDRDVKEVALTYGFTSE